MSEPAPERVEDGDALEREFEDVLGVLRRFEPVEAPAGLEERIVMKLKLVRVDDDAPFEPRVLPGVSLRCAYCHEALERDDGAFCASCLAPHHPECFQEHGHCCVPGCQETKVVRPERARARPLRSTRRRPRLLLAGLSFAVAVLGVAALNVLNHRRAPARIDEVTDYERFKKAYDEGLQAFRDYNNAERAGDPALASAKRREAHERLSRAMDMITRILDNHRGPDGMTLPEYEGYEPDQQRIAQYLVDLEKRADVVVVNQSPVVETPSAWLRRGVTRYKQGDLDGAQADLDRALALDPTLTEAYVYRGMVREAKGDLAGAIADYDRAIELDPRGASSFERRGAARLQQGDAAAALQDFDRAIALSPTAPTVWLGRGVSRVTLGDPEGALADFTRALELDPRELRALSGRGRVRLQLGQLDQALADIDRAIELEPRSVDALLLRAQANAQRGDDAAARADLERVLELAPESPAAATARVTLTRIGTR